MIWLIIVASLSFGLMWSCASVARGSTSPPSYGCHLRLLFVLATEHTLLRMFLNICRQVLFPGDLHDAAL